MSFRTLRSIAPVLLASLLGACVNLGPASDPSRYFHFPPPSPGLAPSAAGISIGLGEVSLPGYLGGSHIVRRINPAEIRRSPSDYWAEPLGEQVQRAIRDGIATALGAPRIAVYPWREDQAPDFRLDVHLVRFEPDSLGLVELEGDWTVSRVASGEVVRHGRGTWRDQAAAPGTEEQVAAMGRVLQQLTDEIAAALRLIGN